jgi:hypothetical protein
MIGELDVGGCDSHHERTDTTELSGNVSNR